MRKAALALTLASLFASTTAAADTRPMVLPSGQRYDYRITAPYSGVSLDFAVIKRLLMMTIDIVVHIKAHGGRRYITGIDFDPQRAFTAH